MLNILFVLAVLAVVSSVTNGSCYDSNLDHFLSNVGADLHIGHPFGVHDHIHAREAVDMFKPQGSNCYAFRVHYAKDSYSQTDDKKMGSQFFTSIQGYHTGATDVTLEYEVFFPNSLHWDTHGTYSKAGGKLPGLYGGTPFCSGGRDKSNCFSTRYMWRENGHGELYLYFPQTDYHQTGVSISGNGEYGTSIRTNSFVFTHEHWHTLKQRVHLNDVGQNNGWIEVDLNGSPLFTLHNVGLRKQSDVKIMGMFFCTFFGGHDSAWRSQTDTYTLYRNFKITVNQ